MTAILYYSTQRTRPVQVDLGRTAAIGTVGWAVGWNLWLVSTAQAYFAWNQSACGTAAARMHQEFFTITPFLLLVPVPAGQSLAWPAWASVGRGTVPKRQQQAGPSRQFSFIGAGFSSSEAGVAAPQPGRDNQPLLWTGRRRGCMLFSSSARPARRVAGHRASSVMRRSERAHED